MLVGMERELVAIFAEAIAQVLPAIGRDKALLKPVTMSLFGMLNWHYMWFREQRHDEPRGLCGSGDDRADRRRAGARTGENQRAGSVFRSSPRRRRPSAT